MRVLTVALVLVVLAAVSVGVNLPGLTGDSIP